jgi:hypothetical protein
VAAIAWLVLTTVRRLTSSTAAVIVAGALLANVELLMFVNFVLSDILFAALSVAVLVAAVRVAERPARAPVIGGTLVLAFALVFRPAAMPLLIVWLVALLWPRLGSRARRWLVPAVILAVAALMLLVALVLREGRAGRYAGVLPGWFTVLKLIFDQGIIVAGRQETWVRPPAWYGDYALMLFRRWVYFFAFIHRGYSTAHKLVNMLFYVPMYSLALAALLRRRDERWSAAATLLAVAVVSISALHAILGIDFDHRYRLPVLPPLIMLASLGAAGLISSARDDQ